MLGASSSALGGPAMNSTDKGALDRLAGAYERMLQRVHASLDAREREGRNLRQQLEQAREKAVELGELTREEAERVAGYLERDLKDAAGFIADTGQQLRDWLRLDLERIEHGALDLFAQVADQTSLQLKALADRAQQAQNLHTGEVAGPGTLECVRCGKSLHFDRPGRIPPCPQCHGTEFRRPATASRS